MTVSHAGGTGAMEDIIAWLYHEMILLQQVVAPPIGIRKKVQKVVKLLKVANKEINQLQEWPSKYWER